MNRRDFLKMGGMGALSLLLSVISVVLTLYIPVVIGSAIDLIIEPPEKINFDTMLKLFVKAGSAAGIAAAAQWAMSIINNRVAYQTVERLRSDAIRKLNRLPLSYIDSHSSGDIVSRVITDADAFSDVTDAPSEPTAPDALSGVSGAGLPDCAGAAGCGRACVRTDTPLCGAGRSRSANNTHKNNAVSPSRTHSP